VVLVDADTLVRPGLIAALAVRAGASGRPVQASYTLELPRDAWLGARLSAFAFRLRNVVRPRGLERLSLPCLLAGSGMAIPWRLLESAALAHGATAEDLALSAELALAGAPPVFCEEAALAGRIPERAREALAQRRRWEHGHLRVARQQAPRLLRAALARRDPALAALALDLCVPPLSLFAWTWLAAFSLCLALGAHALLLLLTLAGALAATGVAGAWLRFGRDLVPASRWLELPAYLVAKLPIHVGWLWRRDDRWARQERR
jgi:cellulose synthase/poly-beta-1,6-N-acetylglucosamine synthase-like glycosyltransferase